MFTSRRRRSELDDLAEASMFIGVGVLVYGVTIGVETCNQIKHAYYHLTFQPHERVDDSDHSFPKYVRK